MSSFQYHLHAHVCWAQKQLSLLSQCNNCNWNVIIIILLRKGNILVLAFLYKALFKAELPWVNTHTTRGIKYCTGCAKDTKCSPSVHHSWFWFRCSTYILGVSLCSKIMYTVSTKNTTKHSAFQKLSWKIPHVGKEERAQTEYTQMSMRASAMKMFLAGTDRQEPWQGTVCSEKCPDEKKHSTKLTRANQPCQLPPPRRAMSPSREILCNKEQQTDRAFDNLSAPLW